MIIDHIIITNSIVYIIQSEQSSIVYHLKYIKSLFDILHLVSCLYSHLVSALSPFTARALDRRLVNDSALSSSFVFIVSTHGTHLIPFGCS